MRRLLGVVLLLLPASMATTGLAQQTAGAGTVPLNLVQGWNLLGNGSSERLYVASTFGNADKVSTVWKWVAATSRWAFYAPNLPDGGAAYASDKGYDYLTAVNGGEGFWVNAKTAFTAQLPAGTSVSSASFQTSLIPGWNLIATGDNKTASQFNEALSTTSPQAGEIPINLITLWAWDPDLTKWYFYSPSLEAKGGSELTDYIISKGYLGFGSKLLDASTGFWVNSPSKPVLESVSQTMSAAQGGTITLASGSSVTIPAGALAADQTVTLSLVSSFSRQPPSGIITTVGPALVLTFGTNQPFHGTTQIEGIRFVLKYGANVPSRLNGSVPITDIVDEDNFLGLVPVTCESSSTCAVVPISAVQNLPITTSIGVSAANLKPAVERAPLPQAGAKSWNGTNWVDGVGPLDPKAKTLVLVHGMLSSVEKAFDDPKAIQEIMNAGGYTQVVGFDYDWSKGLTNSEGTGSGDLLAEFLHGLKAAGLPEVDIEAHSLGGPVVLAASCANSDMPIGNIAMLGSPVMGTPAAGLSVLQGAGQGATAAINTINPFHSVLLNLPYPAPPSSSLDTLQQLFDGPFAAQVLPGSKTLSDIRSCVANKMAAADTNLSKTRLICVAGSDYTKDPHMSSLGSNIKFLFGGEQFDGIVSKSSANCVGAGFDSTKVTAVSCTVAHTQLQSDACVIAAVGDAVSANSTATTTTSTTTSTTTTTTSTTTTTVPTTTTTTAATTTTTASTTNTTLSTSGPAVSISSATCTAHQRYSWGIDYNIISAAGSASGPVGSYLYVNQTSTCSAWTDCVRQEGEPASTDWTASGTTGTWSGQYVSASVGGAEANTEVTCPAQ